MKKVILTMIMVFAAISVNAQNKALVKFFDKYAADPSFTHINISGKMFEMIGSLEMDNAEEQQMISESLGKIQNVQVLVKDKGVNGTSLFNEVMKTINGEKFEELMSVREEENDIKFMIQEKDNKINDLVMVLGGEKEFVLLNIRGNGIDLNMLYKLSTKLGMKGFEQFEMLEKARKGN